TKSPRAPVRDRAVGALRSAAPRPASRGLTTAAGSALDALLGWLGGVVANLSRGTGRDDLSDRTLSAGPGRGDLSRGPGRALVVEPRVERAAPSPWDRLRARLVEVARRWMWRSRLDTFVGRRQADYLASMMSMFDRGDLGDALRHAIPLGDVPGTPTPSLGAGLPTPRTDLRVTSGGAAGASILVGDSLHQTLEAMYRRAFERLDREGRHEEAAFVLAELLRSSDEAAQYLERRGQVELAARLAEARELLPGLVVRLWILAGDVERAVRIARRTGAFIDAITRLERTHRERAAELRSAWAERLADAGDYARAVDVIWPLVAERTRALAWMHEAIALGGPAGARMLLRAAIVDDARRDELLHTGLRLLEDEAEETLEDRAAFVGALLAEREDETTARLARPAVRSALRDANAWGRPITPADLGKLVARTGDAVLRADLPVLPARGRRVAFGDPEHPSTFTLRAEDSGSTRVFDVAPLPGGRMLVALGEAGVRLVTRDGRTAAHFDLPARHLVPSDHGRRVITSIERGPVTSLGRIDLVRTRATPWCELPITAWARDFDGASWFVATRAPGAKEDTLVELDATSAKVEASWQLAVSRVDAIARSERAVAALCGAERWQWSLPGPTLRRRGPIERSPPGLSFVRSASTVAPDGTVVTAGAAEARVSSSATVGSMLGASFTLAFDASGDGVDARFERDQELHVTVRGERAQEAHLEGLDAIDVAHPVAAAGWIVVPVFRGSDVTVVLVDAQSMKVAARLELEGARHASVRLGATHLVVADDRGRIVSFDHTLGRITSSLRL
ncbi:hypothetical protein L6R52_30135, partial [Myxococcota bacterium]|nr:hypothetical protein [Myxococcota bacterium]